MLSMTKSGLLCAGPIWSGEDWSVCYQDRVLDRLLPISALSVSLLLLLVQRISASRRHANSARRIAQLDPSSSNIDLQERQDPGLVERMLSTLMPWNGPYTAAYLLCRPKRRRRRQSLVSNRARSMSADRSNFQQDKSSTSAALAIYHTENAVILNEVHKILKDKLINPLDIDNVPSEADSRWTPIAIEKLKRFWELVGCTLSSIAAATHAAISRKVSIWLLLWVYLVLLSSFAILKTHSYFKHKAALIGIAFLYSISNLRSEILQQRQDRLIIVAAIQLALATITLIPTIFFPYQTKLPLRLRAIQRTIKAQRAYGEARTAIPTPRHNRSPAPSINGDTEQRAFNAEKQKVELIPFPQNRASLYSRALFGFVTPLLFKHYRVQFTLDAVPDLPPGSHAASVVAAFRSSGDPAAVKAQSELDQEGDDEEEAARYNGNGSGAHVEDAPLLTTTKPEERLAPSNRSLSIRLLMHFLPLIGYQVFWALLQGLTALTPAIFLRLILKYIAERSNDRHVIPLHMAITYAVGLSLGQILNSISSSQALFIGRTICIRLRAILLFEIINKALRRRDTGGSGMDKEGKEAEEGSDAQKNKRTSDGELNNLVAIDVFRVSEIGAYLHFLFPDAPVEIALCVYLLINLLGKSALAGLAVLILSMPLQALTARLFVKVQKKLLKATDERLNLTNEVLNCIKTVKFFAWEKPFEKRLDKAREKEIRVLALRCVAWLLSTAVYLGLPMAVTVVTFAVHTRILQQPLPAETAFTALALFNALRSPIDALPDMFVNVLTARVSIGRIDKFLGEEETTKYEQLLSPEASMSEKIGFSNATFTYSEDDDQLASGSAFCLKDINLTFPQGKLSVIAGPVGSGKTTMLMSLLGETRQLSGQTFMPCVVARALIEKDPRTGLSDTVAYCSQSPWLLGATVKENILFGQDYEERRYKAVLRACALEADLKILEYYDETEVGEKGTSLSGGQKARVALARALYSPAKTLLIDDALSAVDVHTAKHLYRHYLRGPLMKDRTVILVTHATHLCLPGAAFAVAMNEGQVAASGAPASLLAGGYFDQDAPASGTTTPIKPGASQLTSFEEEDEAEPTIEELDEGSRAVEQAETKKRQDKKALFANEETYGKGSVGFQSYKLYLASFAASPLRLLCFWALGISLFASSRGIDVVNAAWLRQWAGTYDRLEHVSPLISVPRQMQSILTASAASLMNLVGAWTSPSNAIGPSSTISDEQQRQTTFYLTIYGLLVVAYVILALSRDALGLFGSLQASRRIYRRLMNTIIQARPQWFDRTPIGRIMNRLSKDIETVDQDLAPQIIFFVDVTLQTIVILLVACYAVPAFTVFAILIVLLYWIIGALYVVSSRDLKRLESVSRSPIFTLVGEVLSGAVIIRAYGDASRFTRHCLRLIDKTNRPFYFLWAENRWLSLRVDLLASIVSLAMSLFLILTKSVDAALAGFALSFTIQLVNAVLWVLRMYTMIEINANSIERVGEYLEVEAEARGGVNVPAAWPSKSGSIQVENLIVRYSPELPQVLKGISFTIQPGEKVGIVGRTGSGKSSLALAFFRFLEAESGKIIVDGIDISTIRMEDLRSRLTVIPQEAQLFSGTIRSNLDPFGICEDDQLWDALQRCQLASKLQGLAVGPSPSSSGTTTPAANAAATETTAVVTSLDMVVEQGGKNFSAGQKQLLALARGLLKISNSNIVILDESTASLDQGSEEKIQKTIQSEMKYATMLTIAHRLRGIITFDKVLVMEAGQILEYERPSILMKREGSAFRELCLRSEEFDTLLQMAQEADEQRSVST